MRDEDEPFDDCDGWTEASFIRRFSQLPGARVASAREAPRLSPSMVFDLATHGKVADLQRALLGESGGRENGPHSMPELYSIVGLLEESWKARRISFRETIRGLFTIREVVQNLEGGRENNSAATHFFGAGLIGVPDGEQHLFGAQIVAEKLYVNGWRTDVNVKAGFQWLIDRASAEHFDFVGVSVGSDELLAGLADRIAELREGSLNRRLEVVVGGAAFAYSDQTYGFLGADHVARTADDAIFYLNARLKIAGSLLSH